MREQSEKEEFYNWITHGIGFALSLLGFVLLIIFEQQKSTWSLLGISLYGISLILLYFASTIYHYERKIKHKNRYRILDHISIYVLIAGTYSPLVLITLENSLGWLLFWIVWGIALIGTILKIFFTGKFEVLSVILYLIMGWLIVLDVNTLIEIIDFTGLLLLFLGGLSYTIGIFFYLRHKVPFNHLVWHLFVLAGSIFHYLFIFFRVI
ncbi:MAG: hemolysin III family protein [Flavobacteriaceae bacterium]|nr:hemolysin III family protein [Flavobacteriaceae bacterium]